MKAGQYLFKNGQWDQPLPQGSHAQLLLAFGNHQLISNEEVGKEIFQAFPQAEVIGCTTSGEIADTLVYDDTLCLTEIELTKTDVMVKSQNLKDSGSSFQSGLELGKSLPHENLQYVFVISDGQLVNGTQLINGLRQSLPDDTLVTGGMAGDADRFERTSVWHNGNVAEGLIVVCGFYGEDIQVTHGCAGGWGAFGPKRRITRAKENVLYELDGKPALDLYKKYLGEHARDLPASALLFPLFVQEEDESQGVVRTILQINEEDGSMVFAGDITEGQYAKLMHANNERLIDGAQQAAENALDSLGAGDTSLAILISCVGRRLLLKQQTEEELESVREVLGTNTMLCGFYSYGEISGESISASCMVHNQTMTITVISENA